MRPYEQYCVLLYHLSQNVDVSCFKIKFTFASKQIHPTNKLDEKKKQQQQNRKLKETLEKIEILKTN